MVHKSSFGEKIFNIFNIFFMAGMIVITLYPFWYCVTCSLSKDIVGNSASLMLWPKGFSWAAYISVLGRPSILTGYKVTLIVVVVATTLNIIMTSIAAFLLTRKRFAIRGFLTWLMLFTMYFSGGMIPTYVIYANVLQLKDTYAVLIIPGLISVYNMIVMKTNFAAIPASLEESVKIDGGNDMHVLFYIILPLSKAIISVMVLYYGVSHWNEWFNAMIYISDPDKRPLQLELRTILLENQTGADSNAADNMGLAENIKFATILVATLPILVIYPFIQKYFVKGIMIGAVKG